MISRRAALYVGKRLWPLAWAGASAALAAGSRWAPEPASALMLGAGALLTLAGGWMGARALIQQRWELAQAQELSRRAQSELERHARLRSVVSAELQKERERAQNYLEMANVAMAGIGASGELEMINRKGLEMLGLTERDALGEPFAQLCVSDRDRERVSLALSEALAGSARLPPKMDYAIKGPMGEREVSWSNALLRDETGAPMSLLICGEDVTERNKKEAQVRYLSEHDPLTGLPNRASFMARLAAALARSKASGQKAAILFIDLDHFKKVNDSLGHAAGDALLMEVAGRLRDILRAEDFAARLGGDEFTVIFEGLRLVSEARALAERALAALSEPYAAAEASGIQVTPSIGVSVCPDDGMEAEALLAKSDRAMYETKKAGRCGVTFCPSGIAVLEASAQV